MAYTNNNGQSRVGVRIVPQVNASSLWNSIYSVYNADAVGSSSLKTSLFASYNGESNTNDSKGTNNGTAMGGLTYTAGKIGNAFTFNGTNAYVSLPVNNFNFTGDFSISCWFKTSTVSGNQMIFSNLMYNGGARKGYYIALLGDTVYVWLANTLSFQQNISTSSIISINTWYNIVVTRESGFVKLYVNNSLIVTDTNAIIMEYVYTTPSIGAYTNGMGTNWHFNGIVDALNVWQKSLTQSEITELYNSGNGAQYITDSFYKPTTNDALNLRNGTAQGGLTYGVGKVGTAFQSNGTNSYISLPDNSLNLTGPYSISMWVYFASNPSGETPYLLNSVNGTTNTGFEYRIRIGKPEINLYTSGGLFTSWYTPNELFNTSGWYHLILVKPLNQQPQFYVNGVSTLTGIRVSNATVTEVTYTNPVKCSIGNSVIYLSNYMPNGSKIDALNIWNKVLTQSEITELYNSGNGKQYPN